ncbi:MAG: J domain-containing protein [Planctomycetota bacterium]|nr:MAG: J domain-containing protein [Planctomycetota bacterium]
MANSDYYQTLGVSRSATHDEIRRAYKKLAKENHPDSKPGDKAAAERFKQVSEAYEVIGDEEKRKQYDQYGEAYKYARQGGGGPSGAGPIDLESVFGQGGVDLGDLFGGVFGGGRGGRKARPRAGEDQTTSIQVPFQMAATGGNYDVTLHRGDRSETLGVKIPPGIQPGDTIRLAGQGSPGAGGGPAGDLLITVQIAPHPFFRREGRDVLLDCPLSITEATLGTRVDVPTLTEGAMTLTIPPGTSSGTRLRLRGKGFLDRKTKQHGDQYVIAKVMAPKVIDDPMRTLLEQLAKSLPPVDRSEWLLGGN